MFLIQALEFLIRRLDDRIAEHLIELRVDVGINAEKALLETIKMRTQEQPAPDFSPVFSAFEKLSINEINLDQTLLKFNITWAELMAQNKTTFAASLQNALKEEKTTLNKLLVLNRFKRQLKALTMTAAAELTRRELLLQEAAAPQGADKKQKKVVPPPQAAENIAQDNMIAIDQSVDEWICKSIQVSAQEAQELLLIVLENSKKSYQIPLVQKTISFNRDGVGRTEMAVMACELTIVNFYRTCCEIDAARRKPKNDPGSMVDLLPGLWKKDGILTALNSLITQELLVLFFNEAEYKAYQDCGLSLPRRLQSFPKESAEQARKIICEKARNLDERMIGKREDDPRVWDGLFAEVHDLDTQLLPYENARPILFAHQSARQPAKPADGICQALHSMVEQKGRPAALQAVTAHAEKCSRLHSF